MEEKAGQVRRPVAYRSSYIPSLDGWRAMAILLVLGSHSTTMLVHSGTKLGVVLAGFFFRGGYGVDVFFGLSGFLITTLLLRERDRDGSVSFSGFYGRRLFRILPPIAAYLLVLLGLRQAGLLPVTWSEMAGVIFFTRNYIEGSWYTGHFWSLAIEEHFYLIAPWLLLLRSRRALLLALGSIMLFCIGVRAYEFSHATGPLRDQFAGATIQFRTENRLDALAWGAALAVLAHDPQLRRRLVRGLNVWTMLALVVMLPLVLKLDSSAARRTLVTMVLPLFLVFTVLHPASLLTRALEWSPLRWLGRHSYSLYIWQMLFLVLEERHLPWLQSFPMAFVGAFACAIASYNLVEQPMIKLGYRLLAPRIVKRGMSGAAIA